MFSSLPTWAYGPNGEASIFHTIEEIPEGWMDTPPPPKDVVLNRCDKCGNVLCGSVFAKAPDIQPVEITETEDEELPPMSTGLAPVEAYNPWSIALPDGGLVDAQQGINPDPQPAPVVERRKSVRKLGTT
jgi:hypothetical protein